MVLGFLPAAIWQLSNHPGAISQASDQMETIKLFVEKKKRERETQVSGREGRENGHIITGRQDLVKKTSQFILDMLDLRFLL